MPVYKIALYVSLAIFAAVMFGTQRYAHASNIPVDVELVLAVDISQSMDTKEQELQRAGYAKALTSEDFLNVLQFGKTGRIAVTYMEWGNAGAQFIVADWSLIQDFETAQTFVSQIQSAPFRHTQRTSISSALEKAVELINTNGYIGDRRVIDVSGDGPNNQGPKVSPVRDWAVAQGIVINGLPLMLEDTFNAWSTSFSMDRYYHDCVIGGPGSFVIPVKRLMDIEAAIHMKLILEIAETNRYMNPVPVFEQGFEKCDLFN